MILLDFENNINDFFEKKNLNDIGVTRLDTYTFEIASGLETELILIADAIYKNLSPVAMKKLALVKAVIIFKLTSTELEIKTDNIVGLIDLNTPVKLISSQLLFIEDALRQEAIVKSQMMSLNSELAEVMGGVESQLLRVKKAYEKTAPRRLEEFKGLTVYSKYAAGEDMGGEFFDTYSSNNKIFILMSACSSYLASSSILEYFSEIKKIGVISDEVEIDFLQKIKNEIVEINKNKKKPVEIKIMTCLVDFNLMKLTGHVFGDFQIITSDLKENLIKNSQLDGEFDSAKIELELERGERLLFNSPGFVANWSLSNPKFLIEELVRDQKIKGLDILDEVYFQLRKESKSNFLVHDASSIILEIQKNVMVQV